eukprot:6174134-Pleurochrysis_carterae.AAC.2
MPLHSLATGGAMDSGTGYTAEQEQMLGTVADEYGSKALTLRRRAIEAPTPQEDPGSFRIQHNLGALLRRGGL